MRHPIFLTLSFSSSIISLPPQGAFADGSVLSAMNCVGPFSKRPKAPPVLIYSVIRLVIGTMVVVIALGDPPQLYSLGSYITKVTDPSQGLSTQTIGLFTTNCLLIYRL
jgi:hypothetical protein